MNLDGGCWEIESKTQLRIFVLFLYKEMRGSLIFKDLELVCYLYLNKQKIYSKPSGGGICL